MEYQDPLEFSALLNEIYELKPCRHILEIGSLHGESLERFMETCERNAVVVSVDQIVPPFDPRYEKQKYGHEIAWHQTARRFGHEFYCLDRNSTDPKTVEIVKKLLPEVDFLFIDGGHDYTTCMADWINYSPLVRLGGLIAFHDMGQEYPDVRKVFEKVLESSPGKLVSREICRSKERWGIGLIRKGY